MGCGSSQEIRKIEIGDSNNIVANIPEPAANPPEQATNAPVPATSAPELAKYVPEPAANNPTPAQTPTTNTPPKTPGRTAKLPPSYFPPYEGEMTGKIMTDRVFDGPGIAANVTPAKRDFGGTRVPVKLRENPKGGVTIVDTPEGETAYVDEMRTVFLDKCFSGGRYSWTVKIDYLPNGVNTFFIGVCPSSSVEAAEGSILSWTDGCPSLGLGSLSPDGTHTYCCPYVIPGQYPCDPTVAVPDGSYVTIEFIPRWRVLWYWVNGRQVQHILRSWNLPVHIGVSCFPGTSFTSIALRKLSQGTPLECNVYPHDIQIAPKADPPTIPAPLRPDSLDASVVTLEKTPEGEMCVFAGMKTVFLDVKITEGVFSWKNQFKFNESKKTAFYIGAAPPAALEKFRPINVSIGKVSGTCAFSFGGTHTDDGFGYFFAPYLGSDLPAGVDDEVILIAEHTITVEINADKRTLMFFIQGGQVPHIIQNIPVPLYLGVTGDEGTSFTSLAFSRLSEPTAPVPNTKGWTFK